MYGPRAVLLISMSVFSLDLALSTFRTSMAFLVAAATFLCIGLPPIVSLCFSVIGDIFPSTERAKWTGLLSIPAGIAAGIGLFLLSGVTSENTGGWRWMYWGIILLLVSILYWISLIQIEKRAKALILDPQVLFNRTFATASGAGHLSPFGMVGIAVAPAILGLAHNTTSGLESGLKLVSLVSAIAFTISTDLILTITAISMYLKA